ncbi:MAG: PBP1A family penicillin-binding protein [Lachnospiraceae bacterium]|nr:PBP1A family penicillin-binding protein [Lachnospiraceae bacterium]
MNYSKHGVAQKRKEVNSLGIKCAKKLNFYLLAVIIMAFIAISVIGICGGLGVFKGIIDTSPDITNIDVSPTGFSTFIYDSEGNQTAKLVATDSNRIPVTMDQIPDNLAHAFVAIEDERFYSHNGIDIKGILRAIVEGVKNKFKGMQGASTITQQLLKNNVFKDWTEEDSMADRITRKIQEQYLAIQLEKVMDKDKILENYMNTINLGQNTLGVQAASLRYFDKNVYELTLSECAVIAAITQNPSRLNPISHPEKNKERRDKVLRNMKEQGYITEAEYNAAIADDVYSRIQLHNSSVEDITVNSYFDDAVTEAVYNDLLAAGYDEQKAYTLLYTGGLAIYSTQDPRIQKICDDVYNNEENYPENTYWYLRYALTIEHSDGEKENFSSEMFKAYFKESNARFNMLFSSQEAANEAIEQYKTYVMGSGDEVVAETISLTPQPQISLTVAEQSTGKVVAMVGGRGEKTASRTFNRATTMTRQPGSTFKVVSTYAPALDSAGLTLATVQNDAPFNYANGTPVSNWYGEEYRGINSLRTGIKDSMNIVTVKTLTQIGPQTGFDYLLDFGFTTLETGREINGKIYSDIQQSLALGGITKGVTNLELNAAYACIANGGTYVKPKLYTKVVDHDGNVILDNTVPQTHQVLKQTTAWLLTSAMMDVVNAGTGTKCRIPGMTVAGKTGTTSDYNDVWFSGYTPYYTATTWTGYDNNAKLTSNAEHDLSKTMWQKVMSQIHEGMEDRPFTTPPGIVTCTVCSQSGLLPIPGLCDATLKTEYFDEATVPKESCNVHYAGTICAYQHLPASENCPFKVEGVFELPLPEDPAVAAGNPAVGGNVVVQGTIGEDGVQRCMHNALFFADPSSEAIIAQQNAEMQAAADAAAAAQAAADAAAQAAAEQNPPPAE